MTDSNKLVGVFVPRPGGQDEREADLRKRDYSSYVGGQAEIHVNGGVTSFGAGGKVWRGEIASIAIRGDDLVIRFAWLGAMEQPGQWMNDPELDFALGLPLFSACSSSDDGGRAILQAPIVDQMIASMIESPRAIYMHELLPAGFNDGLDLDEMDSKLRASFGPPSDTFAALHAAENYEAGCWYIDDFADLRGEATAVCR